MDLRQIRTDLAAVAAGVGFNSFDYPPDDPRHLPAAVVGSPQSIVRHNRAKTSIQIPVTFIVNWSDMKDGTSRLDVALSTNVEGSFLDALDDISPADSAVLGTTRFVSADAYHRIDITDTFTALAVTVTLELTA